MKKPLFLLVLCFFSLFLKAQTSKDVTVAVSTTVTLAPAAITLQWPAPAEATLRIRRREKNQLGFNWTILLQETASTRSSWKDTGIIAGKTYEYEVQRAANNITAYGYVMTAVQSAAPAERGTLFLWIDSTLLSPLAAELQQLRLDLRGDGWRLVERYAGKTANPTSVKTQLQIDYNAAPAGEKALFLLGAIPIPYSGNSNWDGHTDHTGAWPCDAFYADLNGVWTDVSVNNPNPGREANRNLPADGKYDQSYIPSSVELAVGRVDFRRLSPSDFGVASVTDLYKRYLAKDHAWRTGTYRVQNQALIDDNFGYFNGEAFGSNGWRNAYPLTGENNIKQADFFNDTDNQSFLMGYGCGGGTYTSAGGVGSSTNFMTDSVNIVFSMLFGSYHGDWDYESNPFMPSALASRGGILTCMWAGRPHWFLHPLAAGQTVGQCAFNTMNGTYNNYPSSSGRGGAHIALLGDPTLRVHIIQPPSSVQAAVTCSGAEVSWTASPDTGLAGYYVYKADSLNAPFSQLTPVPVQGTTYLDGLNGAGPGQVVYQVRAVRLEESPGGGLYFNTSQGAFSQPFNYIVLTPAIITIPAADLTCRDTLVKLELYVPPTTTVQWTGPNGFTSTLVQPWVSEPGTYNVTVTDPASGCTISAMLTVAQDVNMPSVDFWFGLPDCEGCLLLNVSVGFNFISTVSGPNLPQPQVLPYKICKSGFYFTTVTNLHNGCMVHDTFSLTLQASIPPISLNVTNASAPGLSDGSVQVVLQGNPQSGFTYLWSNGATGATITNLPAGTYTVTVTSTVDGCTSTATAQVNATVATFEPDLQPKLWINPNPAVTDLYISLDNIAADSRIYIYDGTGKLMLERTAVNGQTEVDVRDWPAGLYRCVLRDGRSEQARALSIQR